MSILLLARKKTQYLASQKTTETQARIRRRSIQLSLPIDLSVTRRSFERADLGRSMLILSLTRSREDSGYVQLSLA
jgi:hypothetical protein